MKYPSPRGNNGRMEQALDKDEANIEKQRARRLKQKLEEEEKRVREEEKAKAREEEQRAKEAEQRAREARQKVEEEAKQKAREEKQKAKVEEQRAKVEKQKAKEDKQKAREEEKQRAREEEQKAKGEEKAVPPEQQVELVHVPGQRVAVPTWEAIEAYNDIYYAVREPLQYVNLRLVEGELLYSNIEPLLNDSQKAIYKRVSQAYDMLINVGTVLSSSEDKYQFLSETFREILKLYNIKLSEVEYRTLLYHIERDFVGYGKIDTLVRDRLIEDISCNGPGLPVYVYHRLFESVRTDVVFEEVELNSFILRLAQISGRHISILQPIRDAALPDGSRINMTLGKEVTKKGSTFTIRKFRSDPISPVEIMLLHTANSKLFAWLWVLIEFGRSLLISGGTAAGKTTLLNSVSMLIKPENKIVSVEDSVTRDAEILVKEDGSLRKVLIGDYVDNALELESVTTEKGHELARRSGLQVLTCDASGKSFWSPCTALIRHRVSKEFVRVTTNSGKSLTVTADHSLFSLGDDGRVSEVLAGDLEAGSFVVAPGAYPQETATRYFEFDLELAPFPDFIFKAPVANSSYNGDGPLLLEQRSGVRAKYNPLSIPSFLVLDEDLAFLAGLWLAVGFYGDRTVGLSVGAKRLGPRLEQIGKKLGINLTRHSDGVSLLMNSKPLRTFFETVLGLSGDVYSRRVPDLFFAVDERVLASLIRGYFAGDGSASASEIEVKSASKTLLCDLQTLLLRFGLILNIGNPRGPGTYMARVVGSSQVARFRDLIGFEDNAKTTKILPGRKTSKYSLDPIPLNEQLEEEVRAQLGGITQTTLGQRLKNGLKRHVVQRQSLLQLALLKPAYQQSKGYELAKGGFHFDRVVSVEKGRREEMVYDLSVPETGRFIANNILCHNTPEINLAHPNWIQAVTRIGFGEMTSGVSGISGISGVSGVSVGGRSAGDISLFDLLISALRQRPEFIIVGEVRGEEAYTLFQAISVGHATLGTIHAASMPELLARVESQPMNVPRVMLANLDVVIFLAAVRKGDEKVRRVREVVEILGIDPTTKELVTNTVFRWDPVKDEFSYSGRSFQIEKLAKSSGIPIETLQKEMDNRLMLLERMKEEGITNYKDVTDVVRRYYVDKDVILAAPRLTQGPVRGTGEMSWSNGEE